MQKSNSKSYLNRYGDEGVYSGLEYGAPVISIGGYAALHLGRELPQEAKVLCVGCGNGYEVVAHLISGRDAYGTELHLIRDVPILKNRIIKAMSRGLPFKDKTFDAVQCCEVLEHIPEELTLPFMRECLRVGEKVLFTAALKDDPPWHTHINLQQYPGMLGDLCVHFPEVRGWFDLMDRAFRDHHRGFLPSQFLFPGTPVSKHDAIHRLWDIEIAIESVFAANQAMYSLLSRLFPRTPWTRRYLLLDWDHASPRGVDWVSGAACSRGARPWPRWAAWTEAFFMFNEDVDWCRRMNLAGWGVDYVPGARVVHHIGASEGTSDD